MQNGCIERFNRFVREDMLDAYYFNNTYQQQLCNKWIEDYNRNHPHKSISNKSPLEFIPRINLNILSNLEVS